MRAPLTLTVLALLGGCTGIPARHHPDAGTPGRVEIGQTPRNRIVPLVDAHQHMMSPAMVALIAPRGPLASIAVPPPLSDLLRAREQVLKSGPLNSVFTSDAVLFAEGEGRWWSGEAPMLKSLGEFPTARKFVPVSYGAEGATGYISGDLQTPSGENTHNFVLGLKKGPDGRWRIASEMKQRIMPATYAPAITAERVIEVLDDAGIAQSVVLSLGYIYAQPGRVAPGDQYAMVRAENDWTVAEAAKHPDRLTAFCGVNPFADYTIAEMERCARMPSVRGVKTHLNNAAADLSQPEQLEKLKLFFRTADRLGLAIVIHVRGSAKPLIDQVLPEAPHVPIQIAHMGSGWSNAVLFADAIQAGKPGTKNLYFDWTQALPIEGLWGYGPSEKNSGSVSTETKVRLEKATVAERAALFERMARAGAMITPTLVADYVRMQTEEAQRGAVEQPGPLVSPALLTMWKFGYDTRRFNGDRDWAAFFRKSAEDLRAAGAAGVPMMVGTDLGVIMIKPGVSVHEEMALMVERLGMSPAQVLQAASVNPGRFFGETSAGAIAPGGVADLVLLDADPLANIGATRRIRGVTLRGRHLDRAALDGLLEGATRSMAQNQECAR